MPAVVGDDGVIRLWWSDAKYDFAAQLRHSVHKHQASDRCGGGREETLPSDRAV